MNETNETQSPPWGGFVYGDARAPQEGGETYGDARELPVTQPDTTEPADGPAKE